MLAALTCGKVGYRARYRLPTGDQPPTNTKGVFLVIWADFYNEDKEQENE